MKQTKSSASQRNTKLRMIIRIGLVIVVAGAIILTKKKETSEHAVVHQPSNQTSIPSETTTPLASPSTRIPSDSKSMVTPTAPVGTTTDDQQQNMSSQKPLQEWTMNINEAVMVTVELDFGFNIPSIAEALPQIERRYQPADGMGRTFAILDAYGEPTPEGKLHISMHVSSEKAGAGMLVFRRTGEMLWKGTIKPSDDPKAPPFIHKNLSIFLSDGKGKNFTVDGSSNPSSILSAKVHELGIPVSQMWRDGEEREITFVYSACGCPVKAMVKRVGENTVRTKELPIMFPDDPAAMVLINKLMGWL